MRIYVKSGNKRFIIPVPLIFLRFGLSVISSPLIKRYIPEKDRKYVDIIDFGQFSKCIGVLKEYRGLRLVEVKAKDGSQVIINI